MPKDEPPKGDDKSKEKGEEIDPLFRVFLEERDRQRKLSNLSGEIYLLTQEMLDFYRNEDWESFFHKLGDTLRNLLFLDPFTDNQTLKAECQEVLSLVDKKDISQSKKYLDLVNRIFNFFCSEDILPPRRMPLR